MWSRRNHFQSFICSLVVIIVTVRETWTQVDIQGSWSPCPEVFNYRFNGTHLYGYGKLNNPPIGQNIVLNVNFIAENEVYSGILQLVGSPEQIINNIYSNKSINFEILFPIQSTPLVSSITVNDRVICDNYQLPNVFGNIKIVTFQNIFKADYYRPKFIPDNSYNINKKYKNNDKIHFPLHEDNLNFESDKYINDQNNDNIPSFRDDLNYDSDINYQQYSNQNNNPHPFAAATTTTRRPDPVNNYNIGCGKIPQSFMSLAFEREPIQKGDWPWLAAINQHKGTSFSFRCAGTIISSTAVLSVAHCFYIGRTKIPAEDITIFLGHNNLKLLREEGSKIVNVDSITIHPEYKTLGNHYSDIAIAKFANPVEFSEFIQPACLWSGSSDINEVVGQIGVVVSWGKDDFGNLYTPEPKKVQLPIVSNENCQQSNSAQITNDRTFCGGWRNGTDGPCQGDYGSGIMLYRNGMWYIRGIVSTSVVDPVSRSCNLFEYVVFTDVAKFSNWIQGNVMIFNIDCGKISQSFTTLATGGSTINKQDWPWLVSIHHYNVQAIMFKCGGTIISGSAVLSAAHCFFLRGRRIPPEEIIIFLAHHNLKLLHEEGSKIVYVNSILIHPEYKTQGNHYSDIAIAKFANPVAFSEVIQPACLWSGNTEVNEVVGQIGVGAGWAKDGYGNLLTQKPKKVQLPIVSNVYCQRSHGEFAHIANDNTFCGSWRNGMDSLCEGHAGTGIMVDRNGIWYIRGVVSSSLLNPAIGMCNLFDFVVFTDVAKFFSWIQSNMM